MIEKELKHYKSHFKGNTDLRRDNNEFFTIGSYISDFYKPGIT